MFEQFESNNLWSVYSPATLGEFPRGWELFVGIGFIFVMYMCNESEAKKLEQLHVSSTQCPGKGRSR